MSDRPRVVLHADMDAFYASVEQRDRPELRGKPVVVGGTGNRGVVSAASYEARRWGVRSAMPTVQARKLCPDAIFVPGDMRKYARVSAQIRTVFESISSDVEPLSLDEAFIDVTGSIRLLGEPLRIGRLLKQRVKEATELNVSVGIGPAKLVAKIASDVSKPDGLLQITPGEVEGFLRPLPVWRLWGVGPVTQTVLERGGIRTIGDVSDCPRDRLVACVGPAADHLKQLARGEDARVVEPDRDARSYGEEHTFDRDVRDDRRVREAIIDHAEAVARRLRRDRVEARTVVAKWKLVRPLGGGRFPLVTRRTTLTTATDDGAVLADAALELWAVHRPDEPIRLIGVAAAGITTHAVRQLALFDGGRSGRRAKLNDALDQIVARYGADSIGRAVRRGRKAAPTLQIKRGE